MILYVKLLIAHLIGDFILQPEKSVNAKSENQYRS